ncbi:MAG: DUF2162 domain-containing protein [Methanobrevibacter sp.]|uniref:DUF2162 domain-containing protein n=1 Tax=Methanobrevibacter sp. TaxID=66852 RepID=UPI0026DF1235|nr:DUF2162 domain-containing protein [Methanobrevibacter sp.]MDO5849400.1 DUF2162 domain-containing protein [Methanobrevibacter sp.]
MDIMNMLWQLGVIAAVLVFGFKLGLASGLADIPKKLFAGICGSYAIGVLIVSYIASFFADELTAAIYSYNSLFYVLMALIMIFAGLLTIREWKVHEKNTSTATCLVVIAPCPCCFGSIVVSILVVAPAIGIGIFHLSIIVAIALVAVMAITFFASNTIMNLIKKPYPIVLGNFMLFLGAYFLLSAIVIPNVIEALGKSSNSLSISSPGTILGVILIIVLLIIVGVILNKRSEALLK